MFALEFKFICFMDVFMFLFHFCCTDSIHWRTLQVIFQCMNPHLAVIIRDRRCRRAIP